MPVEFLEILPYLATLVLGILGTVIPSYQHYKNKVDKAVAKSSEKAKQLATIFTLSSEFLDTYKDAMEDNKLSAEEYKALASKTGQFAMAVKTFAQK